jgi:hypothetical protein
LSPFFIGKEKYSRVLQKYPELKNLNKRRTCKNFSIKFPSESQPKYRCEKEVWVMGEKDNHGLVWAVLGLQGNHET